MSLAGEQHQPSGNVEALIDSGLVHPQGLAVDQNRNLLLVADPGAKKIFSYPLSTSGEALSVGAQAVLADGVEARWVATDAVGNIFFSNEPKNQILKIRHDRALRGNATADVIYDGTFLAQVSSPGGVAIDSFHAYWVNKQIGTQVGSIVRAGEEPEARNLKDLKVSMLARNTDKSYGVCLAQNNVYFTQPQLTVYGVKKTGGRVVPISQRLVNPRGCAWDGDGTVYVADRGANAVFSFAGNMQDLGEAQLTRVADVQDAFGVAVFSNANGARRLSVTMLWTALLAQVASAAVRGSAV